MRSPELTPEEQAKLYAKYFHRPAAAPDPARLELMARPIDTAQALMPENINDLLNPGYLDGKESRRSDSVAAHPAMAGGQGSCQVRISCWWTLPGLFFSHPPWALQRANGQINN